ncbi:MULTISPECIES: DUF5339 family protein [unclassified Lysobacter]|uniref:DUF5339 family protein n=1 Tax=unclassified Lysobacter TaxID=2635362 RepID=UPI001C216612|nr:DUF5339 family protein [Lysobacter sp. MMG2]MBU8975692.1 DUF5339 domain-containing protein [Lysobacter sp. MMG2]
MKHLLITLMCGLALTACAKKEDTNAANPTATPAPAAAAPANTGLPAECEDYINRVKACVAKSGGEAAAAQFQQMLDQSKAQWEATPDKASLVPSCKAANDQFAQTAAMLKCE